VLDSLTNFKQSPPLSSYYNLPKEYHWRLKSEPASAIHQFRNNVLDKERQLRQLNQYKNQLNYKIIMDKQLVASKTMTM